MIREFLPGNAPWSREASVDITIGNWYPSGMQSKGHSSDFITMKLHSLFCLSTYILLVSSCDPIAGRWMTFIKDSYVAIEASSHFFNRWRRIFFSSECFLQYFPYVRSISWN